MHVYRVAASSRTEICYGACPIDITDGGPEMTLCSIWSWVVEFSTCLTVLRLWRSSELDTSDTRFDQEEPSKLSATTFGHYHVLLKGIAAGWKMGAII